MHYYVARDDARSTDASDYLTVWSGDFASDFEADGRKRREAASMTLTLHNGDKVKVPLSDASRGAWQDGTFIAISEDISQALAGYYAAR